MRLINAKDDGWPELKYHVAVRDGGCIADNAAVFGKGVAPDLCRNAMGWVIDPQNFRAYEFDHVKEELGMSIRADDDEAHGVSCCGWHHRLSTQWRVDTEDHREKIRDYLAKLYPEAWSAWLQRRGLTTVVPME